MGMMISRILTALAAAALLTTAGSAAAAPASRGEVLYDTYGVPHVYGKDEASVFYGFGYATAQNHGDVVVKLYGEARGRAAEYWGASGVESDKWVIANGIYERAKSWYAKEPASFRANLDAFAAGMNAYAKAHPEALDPSVRQVFPITGVDVMAHGHRLMNYVYVAPQARTMGNADAGSNAWAVMPKKSASGNTLLLANPHLPWAPSQLTYFEADLNGPGIKMYGATQVGLPVLRFMFNERMGFTNTVNGILGATNYELKLADGGYLYDGKVLKFTTSSTTFKVRQPDGSLKTETLELRSSVHGPVFTRADGKTVALRVAGLDRPGGLRQYWDMGKSKSFAEYQAIMNRLQVPSFNIVYGDREGHVQYLYNGILPRHADGGDLAKWGGLVPGDTSKTLWTETHTYAELPKVIDPPSGYVQNTNDPPWVATYPQTIQAKDFPAYMANNGPMSLRAQQSSHLMADAPKITFDDFVARKLTSHVLMTDRVLDELLAAAATSEDPDVQAAAAVLKAWDRTVNADAKGALLFEAWARKFAGPNYISDANYKVRWDPAKPIDTPYGLKDPAQAVAMLKAAAAEAKASYGALDRPFGEVSRFALGKVDLPGNGGFGNTGVFHVITWSPLKDGKRTPVHGETWMSMVEFSTPIKAVGLMSYGNSTQPGSPHRSDQLEHLSQKTFRTLWTTRSEVEKHVEARVPF
jgi:acyl-homoserine-lactone acylase